LFNSSIVFYPRNLEQFTNF